MKAPAVDPSFPCIKILFSYYLGVMLCKHHGLSVLAGRSRQNVNCWFLFEQSRIADRVAFFFSRFGNPSLRRNVHQQAAPTPTISRQASTAFSAKKKHQVLFPATKEQNIARVNLFRKPSNSLILMAIDVLVAIRLIHLLW